MVDTTKAKADAEEGLRIAEKATHGPLVPWQDSPRGRGFSVCTTDADGLGENDIALDLRKPDAVFFADSRTRAPEAYRNVIALADENERLNRRLGEAGELYGVALFDNERLTKERDELRAAKAASETERKSLLDAAAEFDRARQTEIERLRAEVARLSAPGAPMDGAPQ